MTSRQGFRRGHGGTRNAAVAGRGFLVYIPRDDEFTRAPELLPGPAPLLPPPDPRGDGGKRRRRRGKSDPGAVDDHLGHPRHAGLRGGGAGLGGGRLRDRPHHRADEGLRRESGKHRPRGPRGGLHRCRWWRTSISNRTPPWKPRSGWKKSASIPATTPTRRSSRSANTATPNTRRNSSASARSSRRWCMLCKDLGRAMRIGTNHGSLSDRIMNRYGDTPLGMVRKRAGIRPHRPRERLPRVRVLDEGLATRR